MRDINVKGHQKHLECRTNVLSLRRTQNLSASKINQLFFYCSQQM
jgi:hypothetical protein